MELVPDIFWICLILWVYSELTILIKLASVIAYGKEREELHKDRSLRFHFVLSQIALYSAAIFGAIIIGVSLHKLLGGG